LARWLSGAPIAPMTSGCPSPVTAASPDTWVAKPRWDMHKADPAQAFIFTDFQCRYPAKWLWKIFNAI
jgi:hypothetical protein